MYEIALYATATITMLSVAYPILFQVIARLDEKYLSDHVVSLFNKELVSKLFIYSLIISLVSFIIWSCRFNTLFSTGINYIDLIIENSGSLLVVVSNLFLFASFFLFTNKILVYYTPSKFLRYLIKKHKSTLKKPKKNNFFKKIIKKQRKQIDSLIYFRALSDILTVSIKHQNKNMILTLSDFFYESFKEEREKVEGDEVVYPDVYYSTVYRAIEELVTVKDKKHRALEYRTGGSIWLLGEYTDAKISENTYIWIWRNILLTLEYEQDRMIIYHWENANTYLKYSLRHIVEEYDYSSEILIVNKEEVDQRKKERNQFVEFHYILGALLTYKSKYKSIKQIFNYTMSEPPSYELLPTSMDEIFLFYYEIINYDFNPHKFRFYSFPEQSGINSESAIIKWTCEYIGILFLRQYTTRPYINPLAFPILPDTQSKLKYWIDYLPKFKRIIQSHLENIDLLHSLDFSFMTRKWCKENNKIYPIDFIDILEEKLKNQYEYNKINLPISKEKVSTFNESSKTILESSFNKLMQISNSNNSKFKEKYYHRGNQRLYHKDVFTENPETFNINFDSFQADELGKEIIIKILYNFLIKRTNFYLLKSNDLFKGLDKLNLNENFVIINIGLSIENYIDNPNIKVEGLTENSYKNIAIYSFPSFKRLHSTLFVVEKTNLPTIKTLELSENESSKYLLKSISKKYSIYSSVIDLNLANDELLSEINQDEANTKALVILDFLLEIRWRSKIKLIQIEEYSEYKDKGLPNSVNEIKPIN